MATTKATLLGHRSATSFADLTLSGDLTVNGTTTTLDTAVQNVDKLEIGASSTDYGAKINQTSTGNILQLQDGGSDVMVVEDGGKVGIGTNDPKSRLNVSDSGGFTTLIITDPTENASGEHWYFRNTGGNFYIGQSTDSGGAWDSLQARVTVRDGGNVDIGGASHDARRFSIKGSANDNSEHTIEVFNSDSTTIFKLVSDGNLTIPVGTVGIGTATSNADANASNLVVGTGSGSEGMTIYSGSSNSGHIYFSDGTSGADRYRGQINYNHSTEKMTIRADTSGGQLTLSSGGLVWSYFAGSADVQTNSSGQLITVSDKNKKKDLGKIESGQGLNTITQMQAHRYNFLDDLENGIDIPTIGFFAQDLHAINPEIGMKQTKEIDGKEEELWGINSRGILAYMVEAIKELSAKVTTLENATK